MTKPKADKNKPKEKLGASFKKYVQNTSDAAIDELITLCPHANPTKSEFITWFENIVPEDDSPGRADPKRADPTANIDLDAALGGPSKKKASA